MAVLKVMEMVGISTEGWGAAARAAVAEAIKTVPHVEELEVLKSSAVVREGEIVEYRVQVKLTFRAQDADEPQVAVEVAEAIIAEPAAGDGGEPEGVLKTPEQLLDEIDDLGGSEPRS